MLHNGDIAHLADRVRSPVLLPYPRAAAAKLAEFTSTVHHRPVVAKPGAPLALLRNWCKSSR